MAGAKAYATISAQSRRFVSAWIGDGCKTPQVEATSLYAIWTALPASQKQRCVQISVRSGAGVRWADLELTLLCIDCRGSRGWMRWRSLICCFGTTALYVRIANKVGADRKNRAWPLRISGACQGVGRGSNNGKANCRLTGPATASEPRVMQNRVSGQSRLFPPTLVGRGISARCMPIATPPRMQGPGVPTQFGWSGCGG